MVNANALQCDNKTLVLLGPLFFKSDIRNINLINLKSISTIILPDCDHVILIHNRRTPLPDPQLSNLRDGCLRVAYKFVLARVIGILKYRAGMDHDRWLR